MKTSGVIFVLLFCALANDVLTRKSAAYYNKKGDGNRIIGGNETSITDHPFQAFLLYVRNGSRKVCGGSIISTRHILTAAHCLFGITSNITARIGSSHASRGGTQYTSIFYNYHPQYNPRIYDYDVGLVVFPEMNIDGVNTKIIDLASSGTTVPAGTVLTVTGWGATAEGGSTVDHLRVVQVPVVSNTECKKTYRYLTPRMLCVGVPEGGKGSCQGDSGGPAVTGNGTQVGLVSSAIGCARPGIPIIFTFVPAVRSWITLNAGV